MKIRTWQIESAVVFSILGSVAFLRGNRAVEWLATLAVLMSFQHAQVSDRLVERQSAQKNPEVDCYRWSLRYYVMKEAFWIAYFGLFGSYAAITGSILFMLYPVWRRNYRKWQQGAGREKRCALSDESRKQL